ncbi:GNAT family N-acetyltransferase [Alkalihalobacillus sp. FSL R5-0424]
MTFTFQLATTENTEAMCQLMHEAFSIYTDPPSSALLETEDTLIQALQSGEHAALLFDQDHQVLAMCRFIEGENNLYFFRFAVKSDRQGSGLGSVLLQRLEAYATERGFTRTTCKVRKNLNQNISFYQKNGYQIDQQFVPEQQHSTPVFLLEKKLVKVDKKKTSIASFV